MRFLTLLLVFAAVAFGCAGNPAVPGPGGIGFGGQQTVHSAGVNLGPHRLWGEWTFYINESHDKVDVVSRRQLRFHLNALKFLEEYCPDCLTITSITNNGNSTIDLTVRMKHPFKGFPKYTGFDVKGIIMFEGSYTLKSNDSDLPQPWPTRMSWRKLGDPEVLNPDGYTFFWAPAFESGSDMPIFNYWEGKYAKGTPTADLNAFKNFYSKEERHIFETDSTVFGTYTIWIPAGKPIVAGYAVDACWEPPLVMPVKDPAADFPITANQTEYYRFEVVNNNGMPITDCTKCCDTSNCDQQYVEAENWGEPLKSANYLVYPTGSTGGTGWWDCSPPIEHRSIAIGFDSCQYTNGWYRGYAFSGPSSYDFTAADLAFTIFDFTLDY